MPTAKKTTAKKAAPKKDNSNTTLMTNEQASAALAAERSWSTFKGKVVATACQLYQQGTLHNTDDIAALLNPLQNELREAIGIATGITSGTQEDKLLSLILNGSSPNSAYSFMQQGAETNISTEHVPSILLAHQKEFTQWHTASLKDRYYPLVFLHKSFMKLSAATERHNLEKTRYLFTALGINEDGKKELISFHITQPEGKNDYYCGLLEQLKQRGLPAPLLVTGAYEDDYFYQKQLSEFFPQSYFIPNRKSLTDKALEEIPSFYDNHKVYKHIIKDMYTSSTLDELNQLLDIIKQDGDRFVDMEWFADKVHNVFCPEVAKALVTASPALRKLMFENPPFAKEMSSLELTILYSGVYDLTQQSILIHQYYEQVLRPQWQKPVRNWSSLKKDVQAFAQAMK